MFHVIKTKMRCSKCKSENIVAPCNETEVEFRCLDCGHERKAKTMEQRAAENMWNWHLKGYSSPVIEI